MGSKSRKKPRRSSNGSQCDRFPVGELARRRATLREEYLSKSKEISALQKRIQRLKKKKEQALKTIEELETDLVPLQRTPTFQVTVNASTMRKRSPTQLTSKGVLDLPRRSASRRQLETLTAAIEINGGSPESRAPALDGMFATICKYGKIADISRYVCSSQKVKKATVAKIKMHCAEYEKSEDNFIRSLSLLYAGGVISKIKYQQTRSSLVMKNTGRHTKKGFLSKRRLTYGWGIPVPKPLPYSVLMNKIEELDMGEVISLRETLCHNLPVDQQVDGVYRNLESFLLMLCKFYFVTDEYRKDSDKLTWFGEREGTFKVAIGGDGVPFGKWDQSMSWLISFLNVGPRVASPNDNFLLFGANCKEDHEVVVRFTEKLAADIKVIEKKTYTVMGKDVTFTFDLIPGDMKFLAFINGELSNSAKYFSSFANVSQNESNSLTGRFGVDQDCKWRPWQYRERITTSKQVVEFKRKLPTRISKDPQHYCYCGLDKEADSELCLFCGHELMQEIKKSVCDGKPTQECLRYSR